jgi:AcrR family transcriptional regulator
MARKPDQTPHSSNQTDRDTIIAALMALLADHPIEDIGFAEISAHAQVPLDRCRAAFGSPLAVLAAHVKDIDRKVLAGGEADMAEESPRERLFDLLMRRVEALAPYKDAIRSLARSARRNPPLALALNAMAVRSQAWMLAAAGISSSGLRGALRAQGLACLYGDVLRTWLRDDDPGMARTMAELDRQLSRGARFAQGLDALCSLAPRPCRRARRHTRDPHANDPSEQPAVV